jgi:hypothetical protein
MAKYYQLTSDDVEAIMASTVSEKTKTKIAKQSKPTAIRSNKNKGKALQNDVCKALAEYTGLVFSNSDDDAPISSRPLGQHGRDVILRGEAKKRLPFSFECKCVENMSLVPVIEQCIANTEPNERWVVVHRKKALKGDVVITAFSTFMQLLREAKY